MWFTHPTDLPGIARATIFKETGGQSSGLVSGLHSKYCKQWRIELLYRYQQNYNSVTRASGNGIFILFTLNCMFTLSGASHGSL